jgi:sec-independent protein translocase protein TatA
MALDDPIVIILILAVAVLLFGANRIPKLARSIGQARKEFQNASDSNENNDNL